MTSSTLVDRLDGEFTANVTVREGSKITFTSSLTFVSEEIVDERVKAPHRLSIRRMLTGLIR